MSRIYKATVMHGNGVTKEWLVEANSRGHVRLHVSMRFMAVKPASAQDVAELMGAGHSVEKYSSARIKAEDKQDSLPLGTAGSTSLETAE